MNAVVSSFSSDVNPFSSHSGVFGDWFGLRWFTFPTYQFVSGFLPDQFGNIESSPSPSRPCVAVMSYGTFKARDCAMMGNGLCEKPLG